MGLGTPTVAVVEGIVAGYVIWYLVANVARAVGGTFGSRRLLGGRSRRWLNSKRRAIHGSLATGFMLTAIVVSVHREVGDSTSFPVAPFVGLAIALLVIEILLGGGHRKPTWKPWREMQSKPGSTVVSFASALFMIPGLDHIGSLLDPAKGRGRKRQPPKRMSNSAQSPRTQPATRRPSTAQPSRPTRPRAPLPAPPAPALVGEAAVAWLGFGTQPWPSRDAGRVIAAIGRDNARQVLPILEALMTDFYRSKAHQRVADVHSMGQQAATEFRARHPEVDERAVAAFTWNYTFDYR